MEEKRFIDKVTRRSWACNECEKNGVRGSLQQVRFAGACIEGHLQEFPWREWVHRSILPKCQGRLKYISTGGVTLEAQRVKCEECREERPLTGVMTAAPDGSTSLSKQLDPSNVYFCRGHRPWLGDIKDKDCPCHLRVVSPGASNVWFGFAHSSIFLPQSEDTEIAEILQILERPDLAVTINTFADMGLTPSQIGEGLRGRSALAPFSLDQVKNALGVMLGTQDGEATASIDEGSDSTKFRASEYKALTKNSKAEPLLISSHSIAEYDDDVSRYFTRIALVHKLRETRVFAGFSRVTSSDALPHEHIKEQLWINPPSHDDSWLPASVVNGEGIFLQLDLKRLSQWEKSTKNSAAAKIKILVNNFERVRALTKRKQKEITPRLVLLHTLAHLLINRLTFECGYASAALRERLYVSNSKNNPMAGLLIYTAGDSEGTMGGLVRMGKPGYFEPVFRRALESAEWCSSDPVCRELGATSGQGPDSCNLAACHGCALLPETSCEEFNRFLDRSMVVDGPAHEGLGFFTI